MMLVSSPRKNVVEEFAYLYYSVHVVVGASVIGLMSIQPSLGQPIYWSIAGKGHLASLMSTPLLPCHLHWPCVTESYPHCSGVFILLRCDTKVWRSKITFYSLSFTSLDN